MENNAKTAAGVLKVLANENRLLILCALMKKPLTVGELSSVAPKITQSALSQHLGILKAHGILDAEKTGQSITYSVADRRAGEVIKVLQKYYCHGRIV